MIPVVDLDDSGAPLLAGRPLPATEQVSAAYWGALAEGRLLYQYCVGCGHTQLYPRELCTGCGAVPEWAEASGQGVVHTFTVIRQNVVEPFRRLQPYVVAIVELDEGPRMMTNLIDIGPEAVSVGLPVECIAVKATPTLGLPFWRPVSQSTS